MGVYYAICIRARSLGPGSRLQTACGYRTHADNRILLQALDEKEPSCDLRICDKNNQKADLTDLRTFLPVPTVDFDLLHYLHQQSLFRQA